MATLSDLEERRVLSLMLSLHLYCNHVFFVFLYSHTAPVTWGNPRSSVS